MPTTIRTQDDALQFALIFPTGTIKCLFLPYEGPSGYVVDVPAQEGRSVGMDLDLTDFVTGPHDFVPIFIHSGDRWLQYSVIRQRGAMQFSNKCVQSGTWYGNLLVVRHNMKCPRKFVSFEGDVEDLIQALGDMC